jgi:hypothetical protein
MVKMAIVKFIVNAQAYIGKWYFGVLAITAVITATSERTEQAPVKSTIGTNWIVAL